MYFTDMFLTRGRLPISSFLCFVGGFSMGSWLTLFHQLQVEKDLIEQDVITVRQSHEPYLLLLVLILSAPRNFDLRDTLRSSWLKLSPSKQNTRHVFVVGTDSLDPDLLRRLNQENTVNNDLLLLPMHDSFNSLTLKLTQALASVSKSMAASYFLKVDDDSFARIDIIARELEERQNKIRSKFDGLVDQCFYWGFFDGRARAKKKGKWKEMEYNLCDTYVPYALGGGYVLSKKCVDFIVKNHEILRKFTNEDVTIGTWLSSLSAEKKHDVRFDTEYESRGCNNKYLIQHKVTQAEMLERYENLGSKQKLCSQEVRKRSSYEYDWTVPPSQCCKRNVSII